VNAAARWIILACLVTVCQGSEVPGGAQPSGQTPILAIPLRAGDRISEHAYQDDQLDWKLPHKRLEHFIQAGVIINEERHITSVFRATVISVDRSGAMLKVDSRVSAFDVPRNQVTVSQSTFDVALAADNEPRSSDVLSVADAAMVGLPFTPMTPGHVGQHWRTTVHVLTTLGSGSVAFDHKVVGFTNGLAEIDVVGRGTITGVEYHLPALLPGSIELHGTAWYDPQFGFVSQESYAIHNRLLKPAEGEEIGFDERQSADVSTRRI
jgi:hypothetical protein